MSGVASHISTHVHSTLINNLTYNNQQLSGVLISKVEQVPEPCLYYIEKHRMDM